MTRRRPVQTLAHPDLADAGVLAQIARRFRERIGATRVLVYGSVAQGAATADSDIDLLVIAPSDDRTFQRLADARAAIRDLSRGLPISPLVLTDGEVAERLAAGDAFIREILNTGIEL